MKTTIYLGSATIINIDSHGRCLTVRIRYSNIVQGGELSFVVDRGAFIGTGKHELLKLGDFQLGQTVDIRYVQKPDGEFVAKSIVLMGKDSDYAAHYHNKEV